MYDQINAMIYIRRAHSVEEAYSHLQVSVMAGYEPCYFGSSNIHQSL